ncbi:MAG: DUF4493 domain-containing protein [Muribaculaceae bacterium]|nr:DUF4493 domain-containing protein [Muribaculaceae bacterium]
MKTSVKLTAIAAAAVLGLASCADNNDIVVPGGEGRIFLSTTLNSDVKVHSRSEVDDLRDNALIWISNSKGVVYQFESASDVPADGIRLTSDNYVAEAWAGDSVPASFTDRHFYGFTAFSVSSGDNKAVEITAKIANSVVAVNIDESVNAVMTDISMTVGHSQGSLTFAGETLDKRGYFMMNSRDKDLEWTLSGKTLDGQEYTRTGKIEGAKKATLYNINVRCSESNDELGGAYFEITIDDSAIEIIDQIEILQSPIFTGLGFDLNKVIRASQGEMGRRSIWISATSDIVGLELSSPLFETMFGIPGGRFDFIKMEDGSLKQSIVDGGINYYYNLDPDTKQATVKLNFEEAFTNALPDGQTDIDILVTDLNGKSTPARLSMMISADPVTLQPIVDADIWATKASLKAVINKPGTTGIRVLYRDNNSTEWTEAETQVAGNDVTANLTGLTPGTTYEYCVEAGDYQSTAQRFTTESPLQVPNASFEDWYTEGKVVVPGTDLSFWDTGNHGSSTMSKTVTDSSTDYHHGEGSQCAKLVSQFVGVGSIGKFAAGNIFAGNYLYTAGTNGELGWGRSFTSRPSAVKAWVRYEPGTAVNKKGAGSHIAVGESDKGVIYVALTDDQTVKYSNSSSNLNGTEWPCVVKTADFAKWQFDRDNKQVIADGKTIKNVLGMGQVIFSEKTTQDGLVEVTIPIEYIRTDAKASNLIFVASASLYGDYFEGGEGSTLYLDDIQFIYE